VPSFQSDINHPEGLTQMKKISLALLIGLIAIGCEKAPPKAAGTTPNTPDPSMMAKHMAAPAGAHTSATEEKKEEVKPETDATATPPVVEEKPVEEKKE
jgi:hypothetical protein